ncbi:MAG: DUF1499 domain-containing protein [Burkholderiaceae bacterium]|nr:DUF1499 domain-containing protein [Burkholderiaceae bacterium]
MHRKEASNVIQRARVIHAIAWAALVLSLACGIMVLVAGPGYRMAWWSFVTGIQTIRWAATFALVAAALGLIVVPMALRANARRSLQVAMAGALVGLVVATPPIVLWLRAQHLPRIHDISTDTDNPPPFVAVVPLRLDADNPVAYQAGTAAQQQQAYPDVAPLVLKVLPAQAFARAGQAVQAMGWTMVAVSPQDLRIEATDSSPLFGFKDDVVVRVSSHPAGSRVDVRSQSRVGVSDIGVNAKRIRSFLKRIDAE